MLRESHPRQTMEIRLIPLTARARMQGKIDKDSILTKGMHIDRTKEIAHKLLKNQFDEQTLPIADQIIDQAYASRIAANPKTLGASAAYLAAILREELTRKARFSKVRSSYGVGWVEEANADSISASALKHQSSVLVKKLNLPLEANPHGHNIEAAWRKRRLFKTDKGIEEKQPLTSMPNGDLKDPETGQWYTLDPKAWKPTTEKPVDPFVTDWKCVAQNDYNETFIKCTSKTNLAGTKIFVL